jgi:hypothetical protein
MRTFLITGTFLVCSVCELSVVVVDTDRSINDKGSDQGFTKLRTTSEVGANSCEANVETRGEGKI